MATFLLTISIYVWGFSDPIGYAFPVKECTKEVVNEYRDRYLPHSDYKVMVISCKEDSNSN